MYQVKPLPAKVEVDYVHNQLRKMIVLINSARIAEMLEVIDYPNAIFCLYRIIIFGFVTNSF